MHLNINLPAKYRLELNLIKKRKDLDNEPLIPSLGKIRRTRTGNKISRFFRHVFEHKNIKKILGTNLAFLILGASILPSTSAGAFEGEINNVNSPLVLTTEKGIQYPLKAIKITQGYRFFHPGIDLDGTTGDVVYPIMIGKVEGVEYSRFGYGKSVTISHGSGTMSLYAHLSKIDVSKGQEVDMNTKIGEMGASGRAFGDHLHLEFHENGKTINPLAILP